jgi:hypothetical protein
MRRSRDSEACGEGVELVPLLKSAQRVRRADMAWEVSVSLRAEGGKGWDGMATRERNRECFTFDLSASRSASARSTRSRRY